MKDFQYYLDTVGEVGFVEEIAGSIVTVSGLPGAHPNEIILFETGEMGQVFSLYKDALAVLLLSGSNIPLSTRAVRVGTPLHIEVGEHLLGEMLDPLARVKKQTATKKPTAVEARPIESIPLGIAKRKKITQTFVTGVKIVDMLIPLGKGQRQLIIGDRKTGKTSFLLQTMYTQAKLGTICIYAAIGKQQLEVKAIESYFRKKNMLKDIIIISSNRDAPEGLIYITPYTAMTIAEYFRDQGKDVLLIMDDLTTHAKSFRSLSLLAKRFPGRNSYPANMFYTHARLLERAGNFVYGEGEVSITALPIAETTRGDLSGYIQTNIMSMTDGHIFFDVNLYESGRRPAINPFLSVSRVGRQTQTDLRRSIGRELNSFLALQNQLEKFSHFGAEASNTVKATIEKGKHISSFFDQIRETTIPINVQILLFSLVWHGFWDKKFMGDQTKDTEEITRLYEENPQAKKMIDDLIGQGTDLDTFMADLTTQEGTIEGLIHVSFPKQPAVAPLPAVTINPIDQNIVDSSQDRELTNN